MSFDEIEGLRARAGAVDSDLPGDLAYAAVVNRSRRIRLIAEAVSSNLRELRGCEIRRDDMLMVLEMIQEMAWSVQADVTVLKPEGFDAVAGGAA